MTAKPLAESTLNIRKVVRKEEVEDESLSHSIIRAIQCLINTNNSESQYILLNITINVTSVEVKGDETEYVAKTKGKKRPTIESEEEEVPVSKIQKIAEPPETISKQVNDQTKKSPKKCQPVVGVQKIGVPPETISKQVDDQAKKSSKKCPPVVSQPKIAEPPETTSKQVDDQAKKLSKKCPPVVGYEKVAEPPETISKPVDDQTKKSSRWCVVSVQQVAEPPETISEQVDDQAKKSSKGNPPVASHQKIAEPPETINKQVDDQAKKSSKRCLPVDTDEKRETAKKCTSREKYKKATTTDLPVKSNKKEASKSNNSEAIKNGSRKNKKSKPDSEEMKEEECSKVLRELEEALKRRIRRNKISPETMLDKFNALKEKNQRPSASRHKATKYNHGSKTRSH